MPEANIVKQHQVNKGRSEGFSTGLNPSLTSVDMAQIQAARYFIGLYSVNKRRMPNGSAFVVENGTYKRVTIPPCPAEERYIKVTDIPHPVQTVEADPHNPGQDVVRTTHGGLVAMSIIHPDIVLETMDHLPTDSQLAEVALSRGCNLIQQGVFFTREAEDTPAFEKQLAAAEGRLEAYYRTLLNSLNGMADREIQALLGGETGLDIRMAAEHFDEEYSWLRNRAPKVPCPNCFEKISKGAPFHKSELLGTICVIDWERAVNAGVKKIEDVPPGKEWWDKELTAASKSDSLEELTKAQLLEFGATLGLELNERSTKAELIEAIEAKR